MADQTLDVKGQNSPLPILRAKKVLKGMSPTETLTIVSTDPESVADFASFCRQTGNELVSSGHLGDIYTFKIKKV